MQTFCSRTKLVSITDLPCLAAGGEAMDTSDDETKLSLQW